MHHLVLIIKRESKEKYISRQRWKESKFNKKERKKERKKWRKEERKKERDNVNPPDHSHLLQWNGMECKEQRGRKRKSEDRKKEDR